MAEEPLSHSDEDDRYIEAFESFPLLTCSPFSGR